MSNKEILNENRICNNPLNAQMRTKNRFQVSPIPRTESIYKLNKVKHIGKPTKIKETDIFNFNHAETKKKETKKEKPNKLLDINKDNKKTKINLKYI